MVLPGIEPGSIPSKGIVLPLHHKTDCFVQTIGFNFWVQPGPIYNWMPSGDEPGVLRP